MTWHRQIGRIVAHSAAANEEAAEDQRPGQQGQHVGLRFGDIEVDFPLALQLRHGLTAQPDVQLQLFSVRAGSEASQRRPNDATHRPPGADGEPSSLCSSSRLQTASVQVFLSECHAVAVTCDVISAWCSSLRTFPCTQPNRHAQALW